MNKKKRLFIVAILLSLSMPLFAKETSYNLEQYYFLTNRETVKATIDFFSIVAYRPFSSATKSKITDFDIEKWHEIKPELEKISTQKNNERNADAFLMLACGKWLFEGKTNEAINMAKSVNDKYPNATTILSVKVYSHELCPFELNYNFYFYFSKLLKNKKQQTASISERDQINKLMEEKFIAHLIEHPMYALDAAKVLEFHLTGDINLLKEVLQNHPYSEMRKTKQYDKKIIQNKHANTFAKLFSRSAHFLRNEIIIAKYLAAADKQEGLATLKKVVEAISDDGFYWQINEYLGDMLFSQQQVSEAEKQYRLALKGYFNIIKNETVYMTMTHSERTRRRKKLNVSNWERKIIKLKKKIKKTGGKIKINTDELNELQEIYCIKIIKPPQNEFSKVYFISQIEKIYKKEKEFSEPENRRKAINEITDAFIIRAKNINEENKKDLLEQGKFIGICFVQLAGNEDDTITRETLLTGLYKIVDVNSVNKHYKINKLTKKKVDKLISQITGKGNIENPAPNPESDLSDVGSSALLYVAERVMTENMSLEGRQRITNSMASSEDPILFDFFSKLIRKNESAKMMRFATRGLERIIKNAEIDDKGKIILKK